MQTFAETSGGFYDAISNTDDIMGKILLAGNKIKYEALLNAVVKISGVTVFDLADDTFKKIHRGEQLVVFGKYQKGGVVGFAAEMVSASNNFSRFRLAYILLTM